jgi:hypothetical protein
MHRRKARPVAGPALETHVLLVRAAEKLNAAELSRILERLHEQEFPGVDRGLHHHVVLAGTPFRLDDSFELVDRRAHRHGTGAVLSRVQRCNRHRRMVENGGHDMDCIDRAVCEHQLVVGVASGDGELVRNLRELLFVALADRYHLAVGMVLVDRDELLSESEPHNSYSHPFHAVSSGPAPCRRLPTPVLRFCRARLNDPL